MSVWAGLCIMVGLIHVGNSLRVIAQAIDTSSSLDGDKK